MKNLTYFVLLLCVGYGELSIAQGQKQIGKASERITDIDQRGTSASPLVVDTRAIQSDAEAAESSRKDAEQHRVNGWNIGLTFVIAICAFLQVCAIVGQIVVYCGQSKIMARTLKAINRQANTMEQQAKDARRAIEESAQTATATVAAMEAQAQSLKYQTTIFRSQALAMAKTARASLSQIQMLKDKERARVEIKAVGLELSRVTEDFWHIKANIELRNVGMGRAYVRLGEGRLSITDKEIDPKNLDVVGGFIDPDAAVVTETFHFFQPDDASREEYSRKIFDGEFAPTMEGFIEYETMGARFHRDFHYSWVSDGGPLNFGFLPRTSEPKTDEEKVSSGFWSSGWPAQGSNDEYEMSTKQKDDKS